jgi:hypothetical protein
MDKVGFEYKQCIIVLRGLAAIVSPVRALTCACRREKNGRMKLQEMKRIRGDYTIELSKAYWSRLQPFDPRKLHV